jgi:hypothetical protein
MSKYILIWLAFNAAVLLFFAARSCYFIEKWQAGVCNDRVARRNECTGEVQYLESGKWFSFDPAYWQCFEGDE